MEVNDFTFRSYQPGDEYLILDMFNEVFGQNRSLEHWYWKYRDHPCGRGKITVGIAPDGTLAAHFGSYPVPLFFGPCRDAATRINTVHMGDKMSRPGFRHVGSRNNSVLAKTFYQFKTDHGQWLPFGYGFPAGKSLRLGRILFGYMQVEEVPLREAKFPVVKKTWRDAFEALVKNVKVVESFSVDKTWTKFFYRAAPHYSCLAIRSSEYLHWRYLQCPDKKYMLLALYKAGILEGWSVFSRDGGVIHWVDALFHPASVKYAGLILDHLGHHPFAHGADRIACWFPQRPGWWMDILDKMGFESRKDPHGLHLSGPVFNDPDSEKFLRKNLYYTMGDSDLY